MDKPQEGPRRSRRFRFRSFKSKLMVLVTLAVAVPTLLSAAIFGSRLERQARELNASQLAASLETFSLLLEERQGQLATGLARMAANRGLLGDLAPGRAPDLADFIDSQRQVLDFPYVGLFDASSVLLASVVAEDDRGLAGLRLERQGEAPGQDCVAGRQVMQAVACQGTLYLVSVLPVYSSAELPAEGGGQAAPEASRPEAWLAGGTPLAGPDLLDALRQRHIAHPALWLDDQLVLTDPPGAVLARPGRADGVAALWHVGDAAFLGTARATPLGRQQLTFGAMRPLGELEASRNVALATVVGVGLLLLLGTLAAISLLTARISRPIRRLREGAAHLAAGALDHRIEVSSGDELEALAAQFNQMAERLQASHAELERKVAERTSQVEEKSRQLEVASRHKSAFLANMSHELRTPMNAIIGYSEILQEDARAQHLDAMVPDLDKIQVAARHLLGLINGILDLSKIEAGKMELFLEETDMDQLVAEVASTMRPVVAKGGNTLELRTPATLGRAQADVTKVRQCLFNLLGNAAKFTHQATVSLEVAREPAGGGEAFRFTIRDDGIGMTQDQLARLFQPFTQADASTTRRFGGTGLGLTITRSFVELMGGVIEATSAPGQGSTFTFRLPVRPAAQAAEVPPEVLAGPAAPVEPLANRRAAAALASGAAGGPAGPTVLVIDDDPNVRALMDRLLRRDGYRPVLATGGVSGLELARRHHPDAITLDVLMPDLDGWCVLSALKADPDLAATPVIMLTIADDQTRAFALGAAQFLTKPIDRARMSRLLAEQVGPAGARRSALIVDDDPLVRRQARDLLEREGWAVAEATDGRAGLACLRASRPQLLLLDLMMPEMDGFELLEAVRAEPAWRAITVVVVTAKDLTAEDRRRLNGSVTRILAKGEHPVSEALGTLREIISTCVPAAGAREGRMHG